jgi:acyl transferase domain-containing protein/acyl carrier protein
MTEYSPEPIAVVGLSAIMPDAPDAATFWANIKAGRYSITEVPPERWDPALYYDSDPRAPDKTYSKIGGWVRDFVWDPMAWRLPIPPRVAEQLDGGQKWAVAGARAALLDAGWPGWGVESERVGVILGNAIGGDKHYATSLRIQFPGFARELSSAPSFAALPEAVRSSILEETNKAFLAGFPPITEDTMPGELSNVLAGRVANLFNFRGPNFTTDAACASGLAATWAAIHGLNAHQYDAVVTGGIDRNMSVTGFVKFCKIGALSATGTRPFDAGADGFVMGEGAAIFVLKRLADAERDGDRIYAVLLGVAGSSDGKGKGITAPNPVGQRVAVEHAWRQAGVSPATASAVEAHGTSTRVGDASELESLTSVFLPAGAGAGSIALSSVKSNVGHLKAAAGAAGLFKMIMSLHEKTLPPSLNFADPNPNIDWARSPFLVNTELREWPAPPAGVRRGGVSAFGFGGTNFHAVLEEYVPGLRPTEGKRTFAAAAPPPRPARTAATVASGPAARGRLVVGANSDPEIVDRLREAKAQAEAGGVPEPTVPDRSLAGAQVRVAIDYGDASELAVKIDKALKAFSADNPAMWKMLRSQGVFLGGGPAPKVAFLYTGQGSQYANMLKSLRDTEPIVEETFALADEIMTPLLGQPLSSYIFVDTNDPEAVKRLDQHLLQTEITQPAVLTADLALTRLLAAHGVAPDMVMGHSLGEYGALVAAGALDFHAALEAVSARGRGMAHLQIADNGAMAAVFAPLAEIERIVAECDGYAVVANVNSNNQAVVGGNTDAVERLVTRFQAAGFTARRIPVSHAFHTSIVAPASKPLMDALRRLDLHAPRLPIVSNVTGAFYPENADVDALLDLLGRQVASPVQFVKGLHTLYDAGARVFVEVGPKKALHGFAEEVLGSEHDDVLALFTNHPKLGDAVSFNHALCGLYASGLGLGVPAPVKTAYDLTISTESATAAQPTTPSTEPVTTSTGPVTSATEPTTTAREPVPITVTSATTTEPVHASARPATQGTEMTTDRYLELGRLFADFLEQGRQIYAGGSPASTGGSARTEEPVVITGAALGLPGVERVFDDDNIRRILEGQQFIDTIPHRYRRAMADMHITRLVKRESGDPTFETIDDEADVIKLAGRSAPFDPVAEFGVEDSRNQALDATTRLAIGAGFDALRDAGIPLALHYKTTTVGTRLPDRWGLPGSLRDDTGVIFASAFPGYDAFSGELEHYFLDRGKREQLAALEAVRSRLRGDEAAAAELDRRIHELRRHLETEPFRFDRRFLFRCLSMGHSQFAEIIGARGPNTQLNAACASTTQSLCVAQDWIRAGRCRRVIVISADDVTSDALLPWVGSGFLASGAAATDDNVEDAAIPFDRRRHGLIIGMGAAAFVVEAADAARERGIQPICEVLGAVTANSAFHGTRLDLSHISQVMEQVMRQAEAHGVDRRAIAPSTVFVSHETYTPARGGSASAEINALRTVFGPQADAVVITNTKGFTGHAMGAGIEEVVAIKALETGIVPPIPNFKETDPELGPLNLSKGGAYPVDYALRLAAGFGSQIAMALLHWTPMPDGKHRSPDRLGYTYRISDEAAWRAWLAAVSGAPDAQLEVVQRRLRLVDGSHQVPAPAEPATVTPAAATPVQPVAPTPATTVPAQATTVPRVDMAATVSAPQEPATAVPVPEAVATEVPAGEAASAVDEVTGAVVSIVSEMTGYPPDLLDLDLDLEADLGVDTVKQAEVFAAVRQRFGVARDDSLRLRDFPTLAHVIGWVRERTGIPEGPPAPTSPSIPPAEVPVVEAPPSTVPTAEAPSGVVPIAEPPPAAEVLAPEAYPAVDEVTDAVVSIVSEMTGYPTDLLDLDLDLEADLGVDTVKQAEVFAAVRQRFGVARDDTLQLRDFPTLAHVIGWVRERTGISEATPAPEPAPSPPTVEGGATALTREATTATVASPAQASAVQAPGAPSAVAGPEESPGADEVTEAVVSIVSEMTGYPTDLLDLDLDLEADLGVDTVKQAEVFAAVRQRFAVARDDTLQLRDFPTLAHVIGWVRERTGIAAAAPAPEATADAAAETSVAEPSAIAPTAATLAGDIAATDRYPRRVPVPVLRPGLALCRPTGISLGTGSRVVVMPDTGGVGKSLAGRLEDLGVSALVVNPGIAGDELLARLDEWLADGPIQGVYWLPALDDEGPLTEMDLADWREALRRRVKNLYAVAHRLYDQAPFLVAATRLGGYHGYDDEGAVAPLGGAVTGFVKAYQRERPEALVKVVDFPASRKTAALADVLVQETLRDPGAVEVGHAGGLRWTVGLAERPFGDGTGGLSLGRDTVFVVTGAAGSIVSAITADLAAASAGTFHLLDLTPAPDPADPDLQRFVTDRDGLRSDIAARLKDRGKRPTPVLIERELARYERLTTALAAIQAIRDAGGTAHYHVVDLTDPEAVGRVMDEVRTVSGHVDVLLHAAGLDISRSLAEKEPREYDLVFDVKSDGWFNLLRAAGDMPIGVTVAFSSIAGRFGNSGQTDYSAANDLLCKVTSSFRRTRKETRSIALDWTAWGSIGMASRGSIPKIMEMAGIEMLAPAAGIAWIRRELTSSGDRGEFVVAGALGKLVEEYDDTGGLDLDQVNTQETGPMVGAVEAAGIHSGLIVRTTLDPKRQPFLNDHRIDGTAVLPGVMGVEGFAEIARLLVPQWHVSAVEDVDFLAPLKFYRDEPRTLTLRATITRDGTDLLAACALEAERQLPGSAEPQRTTHFTASVRLTPIPPDRQQDDPVAEVGPAVAASDVYALYFHGPAYQVISSAWRHDGGDVARLADRLPANHDPAELPTVIAPRLVELCFQAAGLCEAAWYGRLALPQHVDKVQVLGGAGQADGPLYAVTAEDDGHFDCTVLDAQGDVVVRVDGYRTTPLPGGLAEEVRRPLAAVISTS